MTSPPTATPDRSESTTRRWPFRSDAPCPPSVDATAILRALTADAVEPPIACSALGTDRPARSTTMWF